jgi:hypothetical protein
MEEMEKEELEQVKWQLNAKLEEEIRALRKQTEWALQIEETQIKSKYDSVRVEQKQISSRRKAEFEAMYGENFTAVKRLQDKVDYCTAQVHSIFGAEKSRHDLIPLLVLSEDFDAPVLRHAIVQLLRKEKDVGEFLLSCSSEIARCTPLMGDRGSRKVLKLLGPKCLRVVAQNNRFPWCQQAKLELRVAKEWLTLSLQALSDAQLRQVVRIVQGLRERWKEASPKQQRVHQNTFNDEENDNIIIHKFLEETPSLDLALPTVRDKMKLRTIIYNSAVMVDVLETQLRERRKMLDVALDYKSLSPSLHLSHNALTVSLTQSHRYATAYATQSRKNGGFGRWQFEVTIDEMDCKGGSIGIGWDVVRHKFARPQSAATASTAATGTGGGEGALKKNVGFTIPGMSQGRSPAFFFHFLFCIENEKETKAKEENKQRGQI